MSTMLKTARELHGWLAPFASDQSIVAAARALHERGLRDLDAFLPRPIEALEELIAPQRSSLPRPVLVATIVGALSGLGLQWFCNSWDLPLNVGGRPPFSLPAFIPITFELSVLFGAVTAFFGVMRRMGLPHLSHPVFEAEGFERASIDQFWLYVSANDQRFEAEPIAQLLREHGALGVRWTPSPSSTEHEGAEP
jgi:hypothetical protein